MGSVFFLASWAVMLGPRTYLSHLLSGPRLPFTAVYLGSIALTLYFAVGVSLLMLTLCSSFISTLQTVGSHIPAMRRDASVIGGICEVVKHRSETMCGAAEGETLVVQSRSRLCSGGWRMTSNGPGHTPRDTRPHVTTPSRQARLRQPLHPAHPAQRPHSSLLCYPHSHFVFAPSQSKR